MANDFYYNDTKPTDVKYNGTAVNVVQYNGKAVWGRPYTYTRGSKTGVGSVTCTRGSSPNAHAATGTIASGDTIYHGDTIYFSATGATNYTATSSKTLSNRLTVTGNVTGVDYITATRRTVNITLEKNANVASISLTYLDQNGTSKTVTAAGTYTAGQGYSYSWTATPATGYSLSATSGSGTTSSAFTISPTATRLSYTISFNRGGSNYGSWSPSVATAYYGDIITLSGNTVTIYKWDATSTVRSSATFTNGSATGYTYKVTYNTPVSPVTAAQTITATTSRAVSSWTLVKFQDDYSTLTITRTASPLKGAATGVLSNGATIYYNDKLSIVGTFTAIDRTDYVAVNNTRVTSESTHTVTGATRIETVHTEGWHEIWTGEEGKTVVISWSTFSWPCSWATSVDSSKIQVKAYSNHRGTHTYFNSGNYVTIGSGISVSNSYNNKTFTMQYVSSTQWKGKTAATNGERHIVLVGIREYF